MRKLFMNKTLVKYPFLTQDVEIYERENGHKIEAAQVEICHKETLQIGRAHV